jgi:voltage-gated potassium channel
VPGSSPDDAARDHDVASDRPPARAKAKQRARPGMEGWSAARRRAYVVIFEADTRAGKTFDMVLIGAILLSVVAVMMESVEVLRGRYFDALRTLEWVLTTLFTAEYGLRLWASPSTRRYVTSFYGVVDLLAVIPTYVSALVPGAQYLLVVRLLRVLRVFRVLKLTNYLSEADVLQEALRASRRKITVFIFAVTTLVVILGSLMYLVEGGENGFTSIPKSIYWAIVTLTTVGYGDISPKTNLGQTLAAVIMIIGYGIIAVPTGIVTAELSRAEREPLGLDASATARHLARHGDPAEVACPACHLTGHDADAVFCKRCGTRLGV